MAPQDGAGCRASRLSPCDPPATHRRPPYHRRRTIEPASDRALALARGGTPVFPCKEDKRPACPNGFKDASADPDEVRRLWRRYPGPLIGVPTGGASGLAVLDVDVRHGGDAWLHDNFDALGRTRVHATRSGGFHLVFQHKAGLRCSAGRIAPGVDVRAEGGFVIWWPGAGLGVLDDAPSAPWPAWLSLQLCRREDKPVRRNSAGANHSIRVMGYRALEGVLRAVADAPEGRRRNVAFWAACRLGEQVSIGVMDAHQAIDLVVRAAEQAGLEHAEARRAAREGVCHTS